MYAQVLIFRPIKLRHSSCLDYSIPQDLAGILKPGVLVVVPLRTQVLPGIVVGLSDVPSVSETRDVLRVLDPQPVMNALQLRLARWISRETLAPLHRCVQIMLPPGMRPKAYIRLTPRVDHVPPGLPEPAEALLRLLIARGILRDDQARAALRDVDVRRARQYLARKGYIEAHRLLRLPAVRSKQLRTAQLAVARAGWDTGLEGLKRQTFYREILEFLEQEDAAVEVGVIRAETGAKPYHLGKLEERGLISSGRREVMRDPLENLVFTPDTAPRLTEGQQVVWEDMYRLLNAESAPPPILLHGVTGSGKTELYLRAAAEVISRGQQALILVPEISLTPQTVQRFAVRFPGQVGLWHSGLSNGERYDTWRRVRNGNLPVVVGARSALFAPVSNLGLIVVDEEEDTSYKSGRMPFYHARDTAEQLAEMTGAMLVMGSATPSLEAYARAESGRYRLLSLPARILSHRKRVEDWRRVLHLSRSRYRPVGERSPTQPISEWDLASTGDVPVNSDTVSRTASDPALGAVSSPRLEAVSGLDPEAVSGPDPEAVSGLRPEAVTVPLPPVHVVDMRAELRSGNRSVFSRELQVNVDGALSRGEQVILFLNRRGSATYVFCRDCGWVATCPRCDIPLTQHRKAAVLVCHRCNYRRKLVHTCPECGSHRVRAFGLGTEGLVSRVAERWPKARILRWDRDVARTARAHTMIMGHFARGDVDVLVGTQMVARGLDIPKVTVVGVISADTALNLPDFRAAERTFQLLAQVAGRSGRGILGGTVVVQTYHPGHYAIELAAGHDYQGFAERELAFRRRAAYPPAIRFARLVVSSQELEKAQHAAESLAEDLRLKLHAQGLPATDLIGPAPAFFSRVRGRYRWQILLRSVAPADFLREVMIPPGWVVDIDPVNIL